MTHGSSDNVPTSLAAKSSDNSAVCGPVAENTNPYLEYVYSVKMNLFSHRVLRA